MDETTRIWVESGFNVLYLVVIWALVLAMLRRQRDVPQSRRHLTRLFIGAFALLALGDTGHVGFRVVAFAAGGEGAAVELAGTPVSLVGVGMFATAMTVTLFYVLMLVVWHMRFEKPYGWFGYALFAVAAVRLVMLFLPANAWANTVPPRPWVIYRNLPLMALGLGVAFLILRDSAGDRTFRWIGAMILVSYGFYMPVIFFGDRAPLIGMLMIPKTVAYVAIAFLGYFNLFPRAEAAAGREAAASSSTA